LVITLSGVNNNSGLRRGIGWWWRTGGRETGRTRETGGRGTVRG